MPAFDSVPMIPPSAQRFVGSMQASFGDRLVCIAVAGSYARDEHTARSDIDLNVVLDDVRIEDLHQVGRIVCGLDARPELNPGVFTWDEVMRCKPMYGHLRWRDMIVLHGKIRLPEPDRAAIIDEIRKAAADAMMGARHYLCVGEPRDKLTKQKIRHYLLKPLMEAVRSHRHLIASDVKSVALPPAIEQRIEGWYRNSMDEGAFEDPVLVVEGIEYAARALLAVR